VRGLLSGLAARDVSRKAGYAPATLTRPCGWYCWKRGGAGEQCDSAWGRLLMESAVR
jgi:hypothetical protein